MLFDADIFIWVQRGNRRAARLINRASQRFLSVFSYLELLQSARDAEQHGRTHEFLSAFGFVVLPFTQNIGHRALIYVEEYALSHGLRAGDTILAATAAENKMTLVSSNVKHFRPIKELRLKIFRP